MAAKPAKMQLRLKRFALYLNQDTMGDAHTTYVFLASRIQI